MLIGYVNNCTRTLLHKSSNGTCLCQFFSLFFVPIGLIKHKCCSLQAFSPINLRSRYIHLRMKHGSVHGNVSLLWRIYKNKTVFCLFFTKMESKLNLMQHLKLNLNKPTRLMWTLISSGIPMSFTRDLSRCDMWKGDRLEMVWETGKLMSKIMFPHLGYSICIFIIHINVTEG